MITYPPPTTYPSAPHPAILVPIVAYTQRVALLLFSWATLGWLMPTLLLLPEQDAAGTRTNGAAGAAAGPLTVLGDFVEAWLRQLKPGRRRDAEARAAWAEAAGQVLPTTFSRVLHWWVVLHGSAWLYTGCTCTEAR